MRKLEIEDLEIDLTCEPESTAIHGNCLSSGDDSEDHRVANSIKRQLRNDNEWAWCTVTINCEYKGITASESLGCCSYESEKDFKNCDYYDDMVGQCLVNIQSQIDEILKDLNDD